MRPGRGQRTFWSLGKPAAGAVQDLTRHGASVTLGTFTPSVTHSRSIPPKVRSPDTSDITHRPAAPDRPPATFPSP